MKVKCSNKLLSAFINWLNKEIEPVRTFPLSDFNKLKYELRPCDVLLIEGRKRISQMIKLITQTSWSHSALYIGRLVIAQLPLRVVPLKFLHLAKFFVIASAKRVAI